MSAILEETIEGRFDKALRLFWEFFNDFSAKAYRNRQISWRELSKEEKTWGVTSIVEGCLFESLFYREEKIHFCRQEQGVLLEDVSSQHYSLRDEDTEAVIFELNIVDGGLEDLEKTAKKTKAKESSGQNMPQKAVMALGPEELSPEEYEEILEGFIRLYKKNSKRFSPKDRRKLKQLIEYRKSFERMSQGFASLIYREKNTHYELLINRRSVLNTKRNFLDLSALVSFFWEYRQKYSNS